MRSAYVYRSHDWMYATLMDRAEPPTTFRWADGLRDADIIVYPSSPWHDQPLTGDGLRRLVPYFDRLFLFSTSDLLVPWAPGAFTSAARSHGCARWTVGAPYTLQTAPRSAVDEATSLWSFVGSVDTCPPVRGRIVALRDDRAIVRDTRAWSTIRWEDDRDADRKHLRQEAIDSYLRSLGQSLFVVCPRGVGPSSIRIFEAMRAGRCPVIVSDEWTAPFGVDWASCSIQIEEAAVDRIPEILRRREPDAARLGEAAHEEWRTRFSAARLVHSVVEGCFALHESGISRGDRLRLAARSAASPDGLRQMRALVRASASGRR